MVLRWIDEASEQRFVREHRQVDAAIAMVAEGHAGSVALVGLAFAGELLVTCVRDAQRSGVAIAPLQHHDGGDLELLFRPTSVPRIPLSEQSDLGMSLTPRIEPSA